MRLLISYVFVLDKQEHILAHTFMTPFAQELTTANRLEANASQQTKLLRLAGVDVYDIAVPVKEGIYEIGSIHLGLYKKHIDQLVAKLRTLFLGFATS